MRGPIDQAFFNKHQRTLLRLLNSPILGRDMRQALWIEEGAPITRLTPNAVHGWLGGNRFRATLYSNKQYQEALQRNFAWLWRTAHAWDMAFANRFPRLLPNLGFDTYSSQPDGTAGQDSWMGKLNPTINFGTSAELPFGEVNHTPDGVLRAWVKMDLSSLASPVAVPESAVFSGWKWDSVADNASTVALYRMKRDVVEAQITWNIWKTANSWQAAGGFGADDCEQTLIASRAFVAAETNGEKQWTSWDLDMLKAMWDGGWTNNGWLFKTVAEDADAHNIRSSDYATALERPKLVIEYNTDITMSPDAGPLALAEGGPPSILLGNTLYAILGGAGTLTLSQGGAPARFPRDQISLIARRRNTTLIAVERTMSPGTHEIETVPQQVTMTPGETIRWKVEWQPATANIETPTAVVYELPKNTIVTSTVMPSGEHEVIGNAVFYKPITALTAGKSYLVIWEAVVNGNTEQRQTLFHCVGP